MPYIIETKGTMLLFLMLCISTLSVKEEGGVLIMSESVSSGSLMAGILFDSFLV